MKEPNDAVPLCGTWRNAYLAVISFFLLEVALFYLVDRVFS
ncbi:MAG TPA: hypothetical protein VGI85_08010 [Chthoniobacterales bacterium]|jgi:hypothetical protein